MRDFCSGAYTLMSLFVRSAERRSSEYLNSMCESPAALYITP
jgi:hypothetical protein